MAETPPNIELVQLFAASHSAKAARARLAAMLEDPDTQGKAERMLSLWRSHPGAFERVRKIDAIARQGSPWSDVFDAAAAIDPCTAVALYSLGDASLLHEATQELVDTMRGWGVLDAGAIVLDFGCGTGRISAAIAPHVGRVLGIDASPRMVDVARAAVARHANAAVIQADALSALRGDSFDVVLAIDSMPYVVLAGGADAFWEDVAALLTPGGIFLVMNYSYRDDPVRDGEDVRAFAGRHGFRVARCGTQDLSHWDGRAFLLHKRQ
jgi:cyclopropane fatty-acyl-phospholipid synthase-like methyltransferase